MKINSIAQNNFCGVYRLPNTPKNIAEFEEFVEPMYKMLRHRPSHQYVGNSPFKEAIDLVMDKITQKTGNSLSWVKANAEIHRADFSILGEDILNIVTGEKDITNLIGHMKIRCENKLSFFDKIKDFFTIEENPYKDKPNHLIPLFHALHKVDIENKIFEEKFGSQIVYVKTPQELLTKMLQEE